MDGWNDSDSSAGRGKERTDAFAVRTGAIILYPSVHSRSMGNTVFARNNMINKKIMLIMTSGISLAWRKAEEVGKELYER
jgi:hypothetical protein